MQQEVKPIKKLDKKQVTNQVIKTILLLATILSASVIILIIFQIAERGLRPLFVSYQVDGEETRIDMLRFFTGMQYGGKFFYGIGYLIINTIFNVAIAILIATPIGILTAVFIVKLAPKTFGTIFQGVIEMLAAIPSIVYGMFGRGFIADFLKAVSPISGNVSLINAVLVLSMMILPTITMMACTSLRAIPRSIEEGSLALGATETQTMFKVVLPAAKSGIFAGVILAVGRALGEATAVSLVSGQSGSGPNFDIFGTTHMLSSAILVGLKEVTAGSLDYEIRFTMGLVLIGIILFFNIILNWIKKRVATYEL